MSELEPSNRDYEMARELLAIGRGLFQECPEDEENIAHAIAEARAEQRERDAQTAESAVVFGVDMSDYLTMKMSIAAAIRRGGEAG